MHDVHEQQFQDSNKRRDWHLLVQVIYFVNECEAMFTLQMTWQVMSTEPKRCLNYWCWVKGHQVQKWQQWAGNYHLVTPLVPHWQLYLQLLHFCVLEHGLGVVGWLNQSSKWIRADTEPVLTTTLPGIHVFLRLKSFMCTRTKLTTLLQYCTYKIGNGYLG